jgi:hypothetical protein
LQQVREHSTSLRRGIPSVQDTDLDTTTADPRQRPNSVLTASAEVRFSNSEENFCHLHKLPDEILCQIVEEAAKEQDFPDDAKNRFYIAALVCKRWYSIALPFLWKEVYLSSHPGTPPYYSDRLATTLRLCSTAWHNLKFTRRLRIRFHGLIYEAVSSIIESEDILESVQLTSQILKSASSATSLWVRFDPFVPSDCADADIWSILEQANSEMADAAWTICKRTSQLEQLEISLGREEYRYDEFSRLEVAPIIEALAEAPVTALTLYESSLYHVNTWLNQLVPFRQLRLILHANDFEDRTLDTSEDFWNYVNDMSIESLDLRSGVPPFNRNFVLPSLRKILFGRVESSLDVAQIVFTSLPQLQICAINRSADRNLESSFISPFTGSILSTILKSVTFKESIAPGGLLVAIAETSGSTLEAMVFPRNTTDQDLQAITSNCRSFRRGNLGYAPAISEVGLTAMSAADELTSFKLHWSHLKLLRRQQIEVIVRTCPRLDLLRFLTFHTKPSRARKLAIKQLRKKSLRRWLSDFLSVDTNAGFVIIHLDWIRRFNMWKSCVTVLDVGLDGDSAEAQ